MNLVYATALLVSLGCLILLDVRFRLVFARRPLVAAIVLLIGVAFFMAWDAVGISLGVFRHLDSGWATGILLFPQFPLEELLFLVFLGYLTLVLIGGWRHVRHHRAKRRSR
ncbi:lycopene cyclase domain-containing protein [Microbacterium sp.]|uniref:lycopene cyclase domain-containing protein n=1 Tax=Microbacterium sp. TaxID=51671 RepID=UPI0027347162|nr:lycopene cyclase domain-containing protein [Microbacterium sp.]MDP3950160.1 lycopene cyclase domain-containing protein [Microbacterium sp.]